MASCIEFTINSSLKQHKLFVTHFVTLKIMYCTSISGCTWLSFLDNIVKSQMAIFRVLKFKRNYDSTRQIFSSLKLLIVRYINKYSILNAIVNSIKNNKIILTKPEGTKWIWQVLHGTSLCHNSLLSFVRDAWNSLSNEIKHDINGRTLNSFKYIFFSEQALKKHHHN